jgi:hypothetical protein
LRTPALLHRVPWVEHLAVRGAWMAGGGEVRRGSEAALEAGWLEYARQGSGWAPNDLASAPMSAEPPRAGSRALRRSRPGEEPQGPS